MLLGLAAIAPAPAQAASFRDVPSGQWYTSWVDKASDQGLMSGFTDPATGRPTGYFGPDEPLTRAQVATVLWRMAGGPSSGHASFPDVERGSWYDAPVAWCVKAGVVTGYTSGPDRGCFRPDRPVTRQELATMVWRYAKYAGMDVADPDPAAFRSTTDWRTVNSWASEALTWTAAAGVLSGADNHDGTYSVVPFGTATRAMAAKVFVVLSGSPSAAKAPYTVTFSSNGGSAVKAQTVKNGAKASKPADPTKSGYLFKGWYSDKSLTKAFNFNSTVKSNLTLYAKWEAKAACTVTFNANGGTAVKAQSVSSGAKASKPADPARPGHAFKGWYSDESLTKAYDFNSAVGSDLTLYAKWEANKYTVTFVSNGGTSVAKQTVAYGAKASKPSDPTLDDSLFVGWYTDTACTEAYDFGSAVKSDLALYAKWTSQFYAVLYKDGLLSLQAGADTDPSHGEVIGKWAWDGSSRPWCDKRARVRSVVARDRVAVSNGDEMFRDLANCRSMDLSRLDVSNASGLSSMFLGCSFLTSLDVSGWDVSGVRDFSWMFNGCSSLASLDLSGWDVSGASKLYSMFHGCSSLGTVTLGAGCGPLVGELPYGPWYDVEGKEYDRPPAGVAGTFAKTKPATLALAVDGVSDAGASPPAQIVEGEQDGQRYVVVPEGALFECGLEYPELAGRYVGPGVYVTGYVGDADSVTVPLEIDGTPVVSANLSWNDSDRVGMTKLTAASFERIEGKASSLAQLDVSGNGLSSLDIEGLDALVRLNCEGNPIADLAALQAWAAQDGHEAKLPQVQEAAPAELGDVAAPSEPSAPEQPSEP